MRKLLCAPHSAYILHTQSAIQPDNVFRFTKAGENGGLLSFLSAHFLHPPSVSHQSHGDPVRRAPLMSACMLLLGGWPTSCFFSKALSSPSKVTSPRTRSRRCILSRACPARLLKAKRKGKRVTPPSPSPPSRPFAFVVLSFYL